jgi:hypothetical protein
MMDPDPFSGDGAVNTGRSQEMAQKFGSRINYQSTLRNKEYLKIRSKKRFKKYMAGNTLSKEKSFPLHPFSKYLKENGTFEWCTMVQFVD